MSATEHEVEPRVLVFPRRVESRPDEHDEIDDGPRLKRALCAVTPIITGAADRSFFTPLIKELVTLFAASRCSIQLLDTPGSIDSGLVIAAHSGLPEAALRRPSSGSSVAMRVLREGQPTLIVDRADLDQRFAGVAARAEIGAAMCTPISTPRGVIFGVLNLSRERGHELGGFTRTDLEACDAIAMLIGDALERLQSRNAELELRERMRAVERLSMMGELAAGIAHEVANPLATVRSNVMTLMSYLADLEPLLRASIASASDELKEVAEDVPRLAHDIREGITRADEIIQRMKAMVRLERVDRRDRLNLSQVIGDALRLIRPRMRAQLIVNVPEGIVVHGNHVDVTQVIINLIVNADDAIAEIAETTGRRGQIRIDAREEEHAVIVEVTDNGTGIKPENLKRIFQPLFTTKGQGRGTGLGLSISRRLVEEQGGRLEVSSVEGVGTTFRIALPHFEH